MIDTTNDVPSQHQRNWQSVRTVLEGLILLGVVWLGSSAQEQSKAMVQAQTQVLALRDDIRELHKQLEDVPVLTREIAKLEVRADEHERRIHEIEQTRRLK